MKMLIAALAVVLLTTVAASAGGTPTLKTFGTGHVFVNGDECATFNGDGEYGGCYRNRAHRTPLADVHLSFNSGADVGGGAPRFSIPIDRDGNGTTDVYAFIDVNGCGSNHVSTDDPNCQVFLNNGDVFASWGKLVASHHHEGDWSLANREEGQKTMPFIIADVPGQYLVTDVVLNY